MSARTQRLAYLAWITVCFVWGTTYLAIRVALDTVPVALFAGLRWTAVSALLAALLPLFGEHLPHPRTWGRIAVAGFRTHVGWTDGASSESSSSSGRS